MQSSLDGPRRPERVRGVMRRRRRATFAICLAFCNGMVYLLRPFGRTGGMLCQGALRSDKSPMAVRGAGGCE